jgi:hypothetical protein
LNNNGSISWRSFSIVKNGNRDEENEDALFPRSIDKNVAIGRPSTFVMADGATQTSFSGLWANNLVQACSQTRLSEAGFWQCIESARETWQLSFKGKEIPWHAAEKIRQGAYCALIWLELQYSPLFPGNPFSWKALAVGDCCLFIARHRNIYLSLPIQEPNEFAFPPTLVPSNRDRLNSIKGKIRTARGSLRQGDHIILASDALSAWIMKQSQSNNQVMSFLETRNIKDDHDFAGWINTLRSSGEMKNDDTSLLIIEVGEKNHASK